MNDNKLTILYERLSHEDGRENESLSIEHQKEYLEEYATRNGFTNFVHRTDDGWSGTRWDRPGFLQIMEDIERGNVGQILIKDMSRLGRDHLRVGLFLEQLRERGVRLIAVAEGIDTAKGEDDFMPFRNIFAEWHARDTSRKIRAIFGARTAAGKHVTGALPYGYLHDPDDRQKWILDEEAAPVVKRIFQGVIEGYVWFSGYKYIHDKRGFDILPDGTHGTSGFMSRKEQAQIVLTGSIKELDRTLLGKQKDAPDDDDKYAEYVTLRSGSGLTEHTMIYGATGSGKTRGFVKPFIGILASTDPVALDQACIDLVYAAEDGTSLINRIESRNGLHTLEHAAEIGLGSQTYTLLGVDN